MPIKTYSPIYAVLTSPVAGEHLVFDGDKWVNSVGGLGTTGSGTIGTIAKWTGTTVLGDSILSESGVIVTIAGDAIITGLTASQIVETDGSKQLVSVAKGTAYNKAFGSGAGTVCEGNDPRLSDARTPLAHTIASHSDTTATGAELETLTDGSNADALHSHTLDGNGIYDGSGSLSGTTDVAQGSFKMNFTSSSGSGFRIQRDSNVVGETAGLAIKLYDSLSTFVHYAKVQASIVTNTSGAVDGNLLFSTTQAGVPSQKMAIRYDGKVGIGFSVPSAITSKLEIMGDTSTSASISFRLNDSGGNTYFRARDDGAIAIGNPSLTAERLHVKGSATSGSIIRNIFEGVDAINTNVTEVFIDGSAANSNSNYKLLHIKGNIIAGSNNDMLHIEGTNFGSTVSTTQNVIRANAGNALGGSYDAFTLNFRGGVVIGEAPNTTVTMLASSITTKRFTVVHNDSNIGNQGNLIHHGAYIENTITRSTVNASTFPRYGLEVVSTGVYVDTDSSDAVTVTLKLTASGSNYNFALATAGGNVGIGGQAQGDTVANNVLYIFNGTAPTALVANAVQIYSADHGGAGTATFTFRNEENDIIKLYQINTYTQNYTTAIRTVNAYTTDTESVAYTGIDNAQGGTPYAQLTDLNSLRVAYENLRASYDNLLQVVTAIIDDKQTLGFFG